MEFISTLCAILWFLCIVATPITLLVWIILLIRKSEKKRNAKRSFLFSLCGIILFTIIGVVTFEECEHSWESTVQTASCTEDGSVTKICTLCSLEETESIPATGHVFTEKVTQKATYSAAGIITKTCSVCGNVQNVALPQLGTKENPGEITVSELVAEISADIDAAKDKYNGKWIKITGKVTQVVDGGIMTGYYLYGKRGDSGLRIVCWRDGDIYKGAMVGNTFTFVGQVREITTFNATEIGDCTIIN